MIRECHRLVAQLNAESMDFLITVPSFVIPTSFFAVSLVVLLVFVYDLLEAILQVPVEVLHDQL